MTIQYLHCSEVAFWGSARKTLVSALNAVPKRPGTAVLLESTANGAGGEFYDRWNEAVRIQHESPGRLDCYLPLFVGWHEHAEYVKPVRIPA